MTVASYVDALAVLEKEQFDVHRYSFINTLAKKLLENNEHRFFGEITEKNPKPILID